jgi:hypothetical protein
LQLRVFSKKLLHMLEHERKDDDLIRFIIRALAAMGNKSAGKAILPHLDSQNADLARIALQALQALAYPIKASSVEKLMKHSNYEIRGAAYVLCGLLEIDSLGDLLHQSYLDLVNIYTTYLATAHNKKIDSNISNDFPALHFNPSWDKEELEYLINSSNLGLYLLGQLDYYQFAPEFPAQRESGLFSFTLLFTLFTEDIFYFGRWTSAGPDYRWLEFASAHQLKKIIDQDINQLSWLGAKEKEFFTRLFKGTLPDLFQMFERNDQKILRQKQRTELVAFANGQGYTINSIALLIEKAAKLASQEALDLLKSITGVNNSNHIAAQWKKHLFNIRTEDDLKSISWESIESAIYLWLLNTIDLETSSPSDDSQRFWEAIAPAVLFENMLSGSDSFDSTIENLIKSNADQHMELKDIAQKTRNLCYTREMIYLVGIEVLDVLTSEDQAPKDLSEARHWIKQWSKKIAFMRSSTLEKASQRLEDGQKVNPFEAVYERPDPHRRVEVSGL